MASEIPNSLEMPSVSEIMTAEVGNVELLDQVDATNMSMTTYYVDMSTVEELAIDKDQMYVEEVAILSQEEMTSWMANENAQATCTVEAVPEHMEDAAEIPVEAAEECPEIEHNCAAAAGEASVFQWPKPAVKELIEIYLDLRSMFQSSSQTHKETWQLFAERLAAKGWPGISSTQVYSKWRGLKKQYRKIQAMGPAKNRKIWQFYDPMTKALARERSGVHLDRRELERSSGGPESDGATGAARRTAGREEMPTWLRTLWTELEERRKERRAEKQQLIAILNRLSEKL